ncbi:class I SAM-dependent methyltransferase [Streptomyces shenzhenensis]|uniref:S-adenosyl-L-methionine-dependent methyltransferase n=1 Tax=Streptomyces shenzhenensis TaxID=943815 RepID=A0A3M0I4H8_9ACTN|nr:class I SAM-dependent methyltransferase [Streptomyces shenzhenensis]RMB83152.1 SAM-dependent methyltransferase [Streptomyces shenzhenensis]
MADGTEAVADPTAVRVALWRALHLLVDAPPHVLDDEVGLRLADPGEGWRARPDMDPRETRLMRASIVARARFVEDLVIERAARGVGQYVLLGAGLDSFAQRRPRIAAGLTVFEIDRPGPQAWKRRRLAETGYGLPDSLRLVPVDFETQSWWELLPGAGFTADRPAVVASTGVTMYLTREAVEAMLRQAAALAPGSALTTTFMPTLERIEPEERPLRRAMEQAARSSGTPFISFFVPEELVTLALRAGFGQARHVSAAELSERYFAGRTDGLRPSSGEELLVATV